VNVNKVVAEIELRETVALPKAKKRANTNKSLKLSTVTSFSV